MTISDVIFETMGELIDGCVDYFEEDERMEMVDCEDIVEVIAAHMKVDSRRSYFRPSAEDIARINGVDWTAAAKKYIKEYLEDNY